MILSEFDYYKPETLEEASTLLREHKNSMILAGGTDLLIKIRLGSNRPDRIIDIKSIPQLNSCHWESEYYFIGSCVTWDDIKNNTDIKHFFPALHQASCVFGCHEIRNRATIGGNICNASPGAEAGGPCAVYESRVKLHGNGRQRIVHIQEFLTGPGQIRILDGEIMTGILLPRPPENSSSAYRRTARVRGQDLATCAITVMVINPDTLQVREIRVALSAVMKTPFRSPELEEILSTKPITPEVLSSAKDWIRHNIYPRASSLRGSPDYKREVMGGMLEILLRELKVM